MTWVTYLGRTLYGFYGWLVFGVCCAYGLLVTILVPGATLRHRLSAGASKAVFVLGGVPARIHGSDNLPQGDAVVVAMQAS